MLILWDIDGTLLNTNGTGPDAFRQTAREYFKSDLPELRFGGATDSGLLRQLTDHFGRDPLSSEEFDEFIGSYVNRLKVGMNHEDFTGTLFPGALELLRRVEQAGGAHQSLLTGNAKLGAEAKLDHYDIWHELDHASGAYGDDHHDRNELGPIALARSFARTGRQFAGEEVLVIGDTARDVQCAAAIGARCLAVTSGGVDGHTLKQEGAWRVCDDLNEVSVGELLGSGG